MAHVDLWRREAEAGDLPPLCVCCGCVAREHSPVTILKVPVIPPFTIAAALMPKALRRAAPLLHLPVCNYHRGQWWWKAPLLFGSIFVVVPLAIAPWLVAMLRSPDDKVLQDVSVFGIMGCTYALPCAWFAMAYHLPRSGVFVVAYDPFMIAMSGVHATFATAVEAKHRKALASTEILWGTRVPGSSAPASKPADPAPPDEHFSDLPGRIRPDLRGE